MFMVLSSPIATLKPQTILPAQTKITPSSLSYRENK
jgi:hypothetical protein